MPEFGLNSWTTGDKSSALTDIRAAAAAGYRHVELRDWKLEQHLAAGGSIAELRDRAADAGLTVLSVNTLDAATLQDGPKLEALVERCRQLAAWAAALGCPQIIVGPSYLGEAKRDPALIRDRSVAALARYAAVAAEHGVRVAFEYHGYAACSINNLSDARAVLDALGDPRVGLVIDAFGQVHAHRKTVKLVIAAKTSNRLHQAWAEDYLKSKPWRDSVVLFYNREDIPNLLASSDVFVYATPHNSNDSLPRALLEAQSAGLPVVTTDTTGCPEIVRDGMTGFVVPYETEAMAERIMQLIDNSQLRRELGRTAQQWIAQVFNWDQMADQYAKVFLEIAG